MNEVSYLWNDKFKNLINQMDSLPTYVQFFLKQDCYSIVKCCLQLIIHYNILKSRQQTNRFTQCTFCNYPLIVTTPLEMWSLT